MRTSVRRTATLTSEGKVNVINLHPRFFSVPEFWRVSRFGRARLCSAFPSALLFALAISTAIVLGCAVHADEFEWQVVKSKAGVEVLQSPVTDSPFKVTRGTLLSDAGMFDVLSVLRDVDACGEWLHKCKEGRTIKEVGVAQAVYYTAIDSPLMLKDRESYVLSTITYLPETQTLRIDMKGVEDSAPLVKKRVRVLDFKGYWLIEQRSSNQVHLTYEVHMDPQVGAVRAANSTLATSVLETLVNVDRLAREEPYLNSIVSPERLKQITRTSPVTEH